jgi:hypothetical protein
MMPTPSPTTALRPTALPCQSDPDRWFDRADRTHALAGCLSCPARAWCAREALTVRSRWGMWAGIWIDSNLADVAHYLQAIAQDKPAATPPPPNAVRANRIDTPRRTPQLVVPSGKHSAAAAITARSSGRCEIMAPNCSLRLDSVASRIHNRAITPRSDQASGYAVCWQCHSSVERMDSQLARKLGYRVDSESEAVRVPFYWRQTHWVLLDSAAGQRVVTAS